MRFRPLSYILAIVMALAAICAAGPAHAVPTPVPTPKYTVTVHGIDAAGQPDTGDYVILANVNDPKAFGDGESAQGTFSNGAATFKVPAGTYWAVGIFNAGFSWGTPDRATTSQGTPGHLAMSRVAPARPATAGAASQMVVLPQFAVSANTAATADARTATSKLRLSTPLPAIPKNEQINVGRISQGGKSLEVSVNGGPPSGKLSVNPVSRKPADGTLDELAGAQMFSPASAAHPYQYYVLAAGPSGTIPPQSFRISPGSLATVHENLYADTAGSGSFTTSPSLPWANYLPLDTFNIPKLAAPGQDTVYLSTVGGSALWRGDYGQIFPYSFLAGQQGWPVRYRSGQVATVDWNAYPLHTAPNVNLLGKVTGNMFVSANRSGDKLTLAFMPFSDSVPGHLGTGYNQGRGISVTGSYRVTQNGTTIASGNAADTGGIPTGEFYHQVTLSTKPSVVSFTLTARRSGSGLSLSTATSTTWTWRSAHESGATVPRWWYCSFASNHDCAAQPLPMLGYAVSGLALNGTTAPGAQSLGVTVGHLQLAAALTVAKVTVQVSFDGGKTWTDATVTGHGASYRARFTAPAGSDVTLRTTATDTTGGWVSETITRAYATSS